MPDKLQTYVQMAGKAATSLTRNLETWTSFITTVSRLYKYPFSGQLMVFAQKSTATAIVGFDFWKKNNALVCPPGIEGAHSDRHPKQLIKH